MMWNWEQHFIFSLPAFGLEKMYNNSICREFIQWPGQNLEGGQNEVSFHPSHNPLLFLHNWNHSTSTCQSSTRRRVHWCGRCLWFSCSTGLLGDQVWGWLFHRSQGTAGHYLSSAKIWSPSLPSSFSTFPKSLLWQLNLDKGGFKLISQIQALPRAMGWVDTNNQSFF